ncbi:HET-domain-containing protein [Thozetella sp. PMI_491]|nr:HET-domain-containing protein [Thozetella sp. PMI_491]
MAAGYNPIKNIVMRRPLQRDVRSERVFAAAKSLIDQCMDPKSPHEHCQYSRDTVLPARVLDVGKPENPNQTIKLKICETEIHAPYLALSYCWGKQPKPTAQPQPLLLRRDTLDNLVGDIRLGSLQPSIQDAVFVTRQLGFRYLWVDALCIIQDCDADKDEQLSRMSTIYMNAAITIAAASSDKAADGFLSRRSRPYLPDYKFNIPMPDGEKGTVYLSADAYQPDHPLDTRGWALQEFMLSSRMLIFSNYELLWQCKEIELRGVTGTGLEYLQTLEALPWTVFDADGDAYYGNLEVEKVYLWKTIIQQYTERNLTDPEDRLRAVQGITTELESLWRDTCVYGLWKKWFVQLLAWYKPDTEREQSRCLKRAPSWSWASLSGVIHYEGSFSDEDAKVKLLTISMVKLTCRILKDDEIDSTLLDTIAERPDLVDSSTELGRRGLQDRETEYLLLGTVEREDECENGIGLLVVDVDKGVYRRIGLVIFEDMRIWDRVSPREVTLEARL